MRRNAVNPARGALTLLSLFAVLGGCALVDQKPDEVVVRQPGNRAYDDPIAVAKLAPGQLPFAILSENAYFDVESRDLLRDKLKQQCGLGDDEIAKLVRRRNTREGCERLPHPGWTMWPDFPRGETWCAATHNGLHVEVWEKSAAPRTIAVVFRGTEFTDLHDWEANLRWFLRFLPWFEDQYSVVGKRLAGDVERELLARLARDPKALDGVEIVSTGHSLGGGLAQNFAYAFPPKGAQSSVRPVARVYAFDPSPVTGWSAVASDVREVNAAKLATARIFEHGEVLAFIRLAISYVLPPSKEAPAVSEIRYNFVAKHNPVTNHSMRRLALGMMEAVGEQIPPSCGDR
jgi:pimeloyl-ACP methyl ester carboxylesterase